MQRPDGRAVVTLLTPAGALFSGDEFRLTVQCRPGTDVSLRQTGATRLHGGGNMSIICDVEATVAAGARFRYLPYELIPFVHSDYSQTIRLNLAAGAEAWLTEVVSPGRLTEHFAYERLRLRTEALVDGRHVVREVVDVAPRQVDCALLLSGYTHFGTLLAFGPGLAQQDADRLHELFADRGIVGSASLLPSYGTGARVLGSAADPLISALHSAVP
jgi:urease accessory protein UreH